MVGGDARGVPNVGAPNVVTRGFLATYPLTYQGPPSLGWGSTVMFAAL
jgi:hypothetical protein